MTSTLADAVLYRATRLTVEAGSDLAEFRARYEQAVPAFPAGQVKDLVQRQAPWQDMLDLMAATSLLGFFLFYTNDVEPTVRLAGDQASGVAYLMGNNTIMERMFRHQPAILLYAPLHMVIWQNPGGPHARTSPSPALHPFSTRAADLPCAPAIWFWHDSRGN
jgi:hypothetical protein